jgi:hypothetical protein
MLNLNLIDQIYLDWEPDLEFSHSHASLNNSAVLLCLRQQQQILAPPVDCSLGDWFEESTGSAKGAYIEFPEPTASAIRACFLV